MNNFFDTAKTIHEKREILKQLSTPIKALVKQAVFSSVNEGLKSIYAENGHTELKTLKQWNMEGKNVIKGSHALCLWGTPKQSERHEDEEVYPQEDNDTMEFYPICFVFSNQQVYERL